MSDKFKWIPDHVVLSQVSILAQKKDYNHEMMNIPAMWKETKGAGITVVVIDTGVPNHIDINVDGGKSVIRGYKEDLNGHGTHCGGIIAAIANNNMGVAGIAPEVQDKYIAALDGEGSGAIDDIAKAIRIAVDDMGADVISMSLGIAAGYPNYSILEQACNYAVESGVAVFAAAGNEYGSVGQPACYDSVIAVAAANSRMDHADFSNTGPEVDFAAGGVDVYSTYLNNTYAKLSGTSMACPALAAVGALILAKHKAQEEILAPMDLKDHLKKIAYDAGPEGFDELFGYGIPIFGKNHTPVDDEEPADPTPEPEPDPIEEIEEDPKVKPMGGPRPDCVYWRLWNEFVDAVDTELTRSDDLQQAIAEGFRSVAYRTRRFDALARKQK
jgi:subtilisin